MLLWNTQKDNINDLIEMPLMLPDEKNYLLPELSSIIYDAVLLSKGILLNSSIEFGKVLYETGDKHLQDVYKQTLQNGAAIDDMRKTQADNEDILSLIRENQTLQLELYKGCAEYADFTDYISYKWQDVQDAMSDDDVVVEFSYVDTGLSDDFKFILAVAMTKTQGPMAYVVCDQVKAKLLQQYDSLYEKDEIGDLVWGEIAQYFNGKKRLFFSADGIFNNIGIEYLQYNGKPLSDQMEVYRLSSTKELCRKHDKTEICNVALFGGINYFGLDQLSAEKEEDLRMLANDDMMRYALSKPLPNLNNTLREVQQIEQICMEKEIPNVLLFTASEASENAFRKLDNSKINLFHIATHGRYKDMEKSSDDDAMTNSILVFAGANTGGDNTDNNDGIISAADVAQMNLRLCDLAVLSACETGLGKLGDDGVFGLQRGFKNAGVHSLLMALKPVNDKATTELMLSFYSYLMNGKSKREALSLAQHDLRAKGFSNSKYWATFILLDGLD
ncbi:MAG: CHAT domain-containing protein [Prevotella sp.]|nr:CHAT domain-containing protein [Prevotella sp.]